MQNCMVFKNCTPTYCTCVPFKHSNQSFRMDKREIAALEEWIDPSVIDFLLSDTEQEPKEKEALKPTEFKVTSNWCSI